MFAAWGRLVYRYRWLVLAASVISLAGAAAVFALGLGGPLGAGGFASDTEAGRALDLIEEELPGNPPSFSVIFASDTLQVTDSAFAAEVRRALDPIRSAEGVAGIRTPFDGGTPDPTLVSKDQKKALAVVELEEGDFDQQQELYESLRPKITSDSLQVIATGGIPLNYDFNETTEADLRRAEVVSLPLALLMLVLVFGTLVAAGLPLGVGLLAVAGGFAGTLLLANVVDVSGYATNVVTMIGLGVAIDYSLFIVSRFREEVSNRPVPEALARTMATAGRAILFSGLTVAIGLIGLTFFGNQLGSMGLAGTIVVGLAVLYALTFLPALLALVGTRVNRLRVPFVHPERDTSGRGAWYRLAAAVMARPWRVLLPTVAILLLLGYPAVNLRLGQGDYTALPERTESRRGFEMLREQFPGGDRNQIPVVVRYPDGSPLTPERVGELYDLSRFLDQQPDIERVESVVDLQPGISREQYAQILSRPADQLPAELQAGLKQSVGERIAVLTAYTPLGVGTDEARELVRTIRNSHPAVAGEVLVTGQTALDIDYIEAVKADAPVAIAFIVLATYVVLFLLLGSLLLPLKAVLMNFLSISASYGALVWVFQQGHLSGLLNFTPGPIETGTPILMFCILFGLSMDYEVLLLSRVKEEYERTGDNTRSVALSLEKTGRLITGAAAIMATVFFSFGLAETVIIKAIGLGMGLAVVLDATVVRALLVPATMRLMGRWNWWAPAPLARLYNRLGLSETPEVSTPQTTPA